MNSEDVVRGFEQILTSNDTLGENIIARFWLPNSHSTSKGQGLLDSSSLPSYYLDMGGEWGLEMPYAEFQDNQMQLPKPFGIDISNMYERNYHSLDTFELIQTANVHLPSFIANMPYGSDGESEVLTDLLLGPPTIEAARRFVEVGIYISSNNLASYYPMDRFIESMLQSISWPILRSVLYKAPTIQAFAEDVLKFAVRTERLQIVQDLLHHQSLREVVASSGQLLVSAVPTSNCLLVRLLLGAGADPNARGDVTHTPLLAAKNVKMAQLLMSAGADVNAIGMSRFRRGTAFSETIGRVLLADTDCSKHYYGTAVLQAIAEGNIELAQYLVKVGADVKFTGCRHLKVQNNTGIAALLCALAAGNLKILQMVLRKGVDVNTVACECVFECGAHTIERPASHSSSCRLMTALQGAVALGNIEFAKTLIQHGGDVNMPAHGIYDQTALQSAVLQGNTEMTKLLLEKGADATIPGNGDTPFPTSVLTMAVEINHAELVRVLLDTSIDINIPSYGYYGCTALESAKFMPGGSHIYNLLVAKGAQLSTKPSDSYRQMQLRNAVLKRDLVRVRWLVESGMEIDMEHFKHNNRDGTILFHAVRDTSNMSKELFWILFNRFKSNSKKMDLSPTLIDSIELGDLEIMEALLTAGADINFVEKEQQYYTSPLICAVRRDDLEAVRFLLSKGADVNYVMPDGYNHARTALQASLCSSSSLDIFHLLLQHDASINAPISTFNGRSELTFAVESVNIAAVQHLLELGAEVNSPPSHAGKTALQAAASLKPASIVLCELLLNSGADVNAPGGRMGTTALGAAAATGHFQVVLHFLKNGADVNMPFPGYTVGKTALEVAAFYGRLDTLHLLLKAGADTHLPDSKRYVRAAKRARSMGHIVIAKTLDRWREDKSLWPQSTSEPMGSRDQRSRVEDISTEEGDISSDDEDSICELSDDDEEEA